MIRALLVDYGGTLDGDGLHWSTQLARAVARAGMTVPRVELDRAYLAADREAGAHRGPARGLDGVVAAVVSGTLARLGLGCDARAEPIAAAMTAAMRASLGRSRAALARLRGRLRVALVSNFSADLRRILGEEGLLDLLDAVVISSEAGTAKPAPEIFLRALDELGVGPNQAAMAGDSLPRDIAPARRLGLGTCWLDADATVPRDASLEPLAEMRARSFAEVVDALLSEGFVGAILAAGEGSRLARGGVPLPKPLVRVGGRALLERRARELVGAGARRVVVSLAERIPEALAFARELGEEIPLDVVAGSPATSLDSLRLIAPRLAGRRVLLSTVDAVLPTGSVSEFARELLSDGAELLLGVAAPGDDDSLLWVSMAADGSVRVVGDEARGSPWVTTGIYGLSPAALALVPEMPAGARLRHFLAEVPRRGLRVRAVPVAAAVDLDRPSDLAAAERVLAGPPW
jgi:putative hydrolase of the HAD superfamily